MRADPAGPQARARTVAAVLVTCALAGCRTEPPEPMTEPDLGSIGEHAPALPDTEQAFLEALAPMALQGVGIDYEVTGPAGMHGTLRIVARPGGYRHERWELTLPGVDEGIDVNGSMVVTPEASWTDAVQGAALVHPLPLRALARAYLELPPELQTLVMYQIRQWHDALAQARREHPGSIDRILGRPCLQTEVASHRLCVWEDTGLPLSYDGDSFQVHAVRIEIAPDIDAEAFTIPDSAQPAVDAPPAFDAHDSITRLAGGDFAELALWLQPGLRPRIAGR